MSPKSTSLGYKKNLPRVSDIVSSMFPFEGYSMESFISWLDIRHISYKDYMEEASKGGTYVHKALEDYVSGKQFKGKKYIPFVSGGINFCKDYGIEKIYSEKYIRNQFFQGTIDLVARDKEGKKWLLDWKTYGLAKTKYGITPGEYKKPYSKLRKARLQLSLYALGLAEDDIDGIAVVELCEDGSYHFHKLERMEDKEVIGIAVDFYYRFIDQI